VLHVVARVFFEIGNLVFRKVLILTIVEPHVGGVIRHVTSTFARSRRPWVAWLAAWRQLVVQVEMGRAAVLTRSTVPRADGMDTFTGHVNVCTLVSGLILHVSESAAVISISMLTPSMTAPISLEINLNADVIALVVHHLTVLVEAIGSATSCKQRLIRWLFQENVHIAFNLLSGRPINLSILLKALLGLIGSGVLGFTVSPTLVVHIIAVHVVARVPFAISQLAFCLRTVALSILLDVSVVGTCALLVQLRPLGVPRLESGNLPLHPNAIGRIHLHVCDL
jgi:hypothetical protein